MAKVRVSIVGKERIIRESIARGLSDRPELEILAEAAVAEELVERRQKKEPHIVLICCG